MIKNLYPTVFPAPKRRLIRLLVSFLLAVGLIGLGACLSTAFAQGRSPTSSGETSSVSASKPSASTEAPAPPTPPLKAGSQTLETKVVPEEITPFLSRPVPVLLILRNISPNTLSNIKITPLTETDLNLDSEPSLDETQSIVPRGERAWTLKISKMKEDAITGDIIFRIEFVQEYDKARQVPQVIHQILKVKTSSAEQMPNVEVKTTLESIDQQHPGKIYLVIENKSNHAMTLLSDEITWGKPDFIEVVAEGSKDKKPSAMTKQYVTLWLGQKGVVPFDVLVESRVQPGKHLLVATVPFKLDAPGGGQTSRAVTTKEIQVGVMGESMLDSLVGIPSLALIPGFVSLVIWGVLWKLGCWKRKHTGDFPIAVSAKPTSPEFWIATITISIPVIVLYKWLVYAGILGTYGLFDLVIIWLASVFLTGIVGYFLVARGWSWYRQLMTPSQEDGPIDILEKLHRQGLGVFLHQVTYNAVENCAFLLQHENPDRSTSWIGPGIQVTWHDDADQGLKCSVDCERNVRGDPGKVAEYLKQAGDTVTVKWKVRTRGAVKIARPREIASTEIEPADSNYIIEVGSQ